MADVTSYFSGPPLDLKNLPMNIEDPKKKKIAAGAGQTPATSQLPTAKPTNGPLPTVASVVSGAGSPPAMQRGVDVRPPVQASPLQDAAGKVKEFLTRQLTPEEAKQPTQKTKDLDRLKTNRSKAMSEFASAFR